MLTFAAGMLVHSPVGRARFTPANVSSSAVPRCIPCGAVSANRGACGLPLVGAFFWAELFDSIVSRMPSASRNNGATRQMRLMAALKRRELTIDGGAGKALADQRGGRDERRLNLIRAMSRMQT